MPLVRKAPAGKGVAASPKGRLQSASADERFAAARDLAGQADAVAILADALALEADARVREAILTGLARVGNAASAQAIIPLIASDDASVRTGALDALRLMPDAVSANLGDLLQNPDADVRLLACELARGLPGPASTAAICKLLGTEAEANVCAAALDVLAEVGGPEALPTLDLCRDRFADVPFLSFAIRVAADRIGARPAERRG